MNKNRTFRCSVVLALAALLMNTFAVWAYPAEPPQAVGPQDPYILQPCYEVLRTADKVTSGIDIPSRQAEYAALDRVGDCVRIAGASLTVPTTGLPVSSAERFLQMKDLQAERMDRPGAPYHTPADQRWMDFKDLQAERMSQ